MFWYDILMMVCMENMLAKPFLPTQTVGEETETSAFVQAADETAAKLLFYAACEKLDDINNWDKLCGALSANFVLTDELGTPIITKVAKGNYIRIDLPGPGPKIGDGYDWVEIETVDHLIINTYQTLHLIQARPSKNPCSNNSQVAHFLTDKATSSFVVMLDGATVSAAVFGRNELPNTQETDHLFDKVRNAIVGSSGAIGLSKLQWKALVDGVLKQ